MLIPGSIPGEPNLIGLDWDLGTGTETPLGASVLKIGNSCLMTQKTGSSLNTQWKELDR